MQVLHRLHLAPGVQGVFGNFKKILFSTTCKSKIPKSYRPSAGLRRSFFRIRAKTSPRAIPLASPSSIACRSMASFISSSRSLCSKARSAARMTSLAFSYFPLAIRLAINRSSLPVRLTFLVGTDTSWLILYGAMAIFANKFAGLHPLALPHQWLRRAICGDPIQIDLT